MHQVGVSYHHEKNICRKNILWIHLSAQFQWGQTHICRNAHYRDYAAAQHSPPLPPSSIPVCRATRVQSVCFSPHSLFMNKSYERVFRARSSSENSKAWLNSYIDNDLSESFLKWNMSLFFVPFGGAQCNTWSFNQWHLAHFVQHVYS